MSAILIVKTAALGDVLRTTSIVPGLKKRYPGATITWVTAPEAVDLVRTHPEIDEVVPVSLRDERAVQALSARWASMRWTRVISLDDEMPACRLASSLQCDVLSGAFVNGAGERAYTPDVAPWFDMGLLSVHGKKRADELKVINQKSHPQIYAEMLGISMGKPRLECPDSSRRFAESFTRTHRITRVLPIVGFNTGAGGRWVSKQLSVERTVAVANLVAQARDRQIVFLVFGGPAETERNGSIVAGIEALGLRAIDAGCDNALLDFSALVGLCNLLVTSDSLALHIGLAMNVRVVAFFAPTSAAEIELYGLGEKVVSTAPDYCSYRPDADNATVTPELVAEAVLRVLKRA